MLAWLGAVLSLVALAQLASGTKLAYGFFESLEGGLPYGPFVNRNHFAGYMLLVLPIALGLLADAWRSYARRVGDNPNARRSLVGLQTREGTRLVYAALPPLVGIGALLASTSRGGILAFFAALGIAAVGVRARKGTPAWAAALVFAAVALTWFGLERLEVRFLRASDDAPGRTVVWRESLEAMHGSRWATGYGFNAYAEALSRVPAWRLPGGRRPGRRRWRRGSPPGSGSATARRATCRGWRGTARRTPTGCSCWWRRGCRGSSSACGPPSPPSPRRGATRGSSPPSPAC